MQRWLQPVLLVLALLATALVYLPGLNGPFVFDDGPNIVHNTSIAIHHLDLHSLKQAAFSSSSGPMMRPISMLSFAINHYVSGLNPYYFKLTNLVIHLFNGIGVFVLISIIMRFYKKRFEPRLSSDQAQWLSLAVATIWLLHPFNLTSVLYTVQRMTSLSAFFSIWGLVIFVWGRNRLYEGGEGILQILVSVLLFTPLAMLSKENGALLPALMLAIEVSLYTFHTEKLSARRFLIGFYALFVVVPAAITLTYVVTHLDWLSAAYKIRDFTLAERFMTESRVLWFYIWQILLPSTAQMGLFHDDIAISRGVFQPVSTVLSLIGLIALLGLSWVSRKKAPMITLGVLFFLVGHLLESTIWPLEIAHEHRNYLPMIGILLGVMFYLLNPLKFTDTLRLRQLVAVMLIGLFAFNTFSRAIKWADLFSLFQAEVDHHPDSSIANGQMGAVFSNMMSSDPNSMDIFFTSAQQFYEKASRLNPNDTNALFGLIMLSANKGKTVESSWIQDLENRLENAPFAANTSDKLLVLTNCQLGGNCNLANSELNGLLKAALRNPTLSGENRAKILYAYSSYLINTEHDYPASIEVMHQMVRAAPQVFEYRFALVKLFVALHRYGEAKEELFTLKQLNTLRDHREEIALEEEAISKQQDELPH